MRYPLVSVLAVLALFGAWELATDLFSLSPMTLPSPRLIAKSSRPCWSTAIPEDGGEHPREPAANPDRPARWRWPWRADRPPDGLRPLRQCCSHAGLGFIRPIPPIAFIPLVILWFGIGELSNILLIFVASFNYTVLASAAGMRSVPEQLARAGTNLGLTRLQVFTSVMLPAAMPHIFTGINYSIAVSWAVASPRADRRTSRPRLNHRRCRHVFNTPEVLIGVFIIGAIGLLFEIAITAVERRVLHWQSKA